MTNINQLNSLVCDIDNINEQISNVDVKLLQEYIVKTHDKGFEIIRECSKFIEEHLNIFTNLKFVSAKHDSKYNIYFEQRGLVFLIREGAVIRLWMMPKDKTSSGYYDHEEIPFHSWYDFTNKFDFRNHPENDIEKLVCLKNRIDEFYAECEKLPGLIMDFLLKVKNSESKSLSKINTAIDNSANRKEVIYRIEMTKETLN